MTYGRDDLGMRKVAGAEAGMAAREKMPMHWGRAARKVVPPNLGAHMPMRTSETPKKSERRRLGNARRAVGCVDFTAMGATSATVGCLARRRSKCCDTCALGEAGPGV